MQGQFLLSGCDHHHHLAVPNVISGWGRRGWRNHARKGSTHEQHGAPNRAAQRLSHTAPCCTPLGVKTATYVHTHTRVSCQQMIPWLGSTACMFSKRPPACSQSAQCPHPGR